MIILENMFMLMSRAEFPDVQKFMQCRYLGLFTEEVEAAEAYDRASVESKGIKAITNFDISKYLDLLSRMLLPSSFKTAFANAAVMLPCCSKDLRLRRMICLLTYTEQETPTSIMSLVLPLHCCLVIA